MVLHTPKENRPNEEQEKEMKTPITDNNESLADQANRLQDEHLEHLKKHRDSYRYADAVHAAQTHMNQSHQRIFANSTPGNMTNPVDKTQNPFNSLGWNPRPNPAQTEEGFYLQNNFDNIGQNPHQPPQTPPQFNYTGFTYDPQQTTQSNEYEDTICIYHTDAWKLTDTKASVALRAWIEAAIYGGDSEGIENVTPQVVTAFNKIGSLIRVFPFVVKDVVHQLGILSDSKQLVITTNNFQYKVLCEVLGAFLALEPAGTEWSFKGHLYGRYGWQMGRCPRRFVVDADGFDDLIIENHELYTEIKN